MPGYCVAGTVGHKVISGAKKIEFENRQIVSKFLKISIKLANFVLCRCYKPTGLVSLFYCSVIILCFPYM